MKKDSKRDQYLVKLRLYEKNFLSKLKKSKNLKK